MSTIATTPAAAQQPEPPLYRITVDQYDRMIETGILVEGDPIELVDGFLITKMPKGPEHSYSIKAVITTLLGMLPTGYTWRAEQPIRIPNFDEPEPDFAIVRGTDKDYRDRHPGPGDVVLVVEVALSSLGEDRGKKLAAYAKASISAYWIVNLKERQIEVYTDPHAEAYGRRLDFKPGDAIPVVIDGNHTGQIAVADVLS